MIDAIDECADSVPDGSSIYTLIRDHINKFPDFIKFFITTRPFMNIKHQLSVLKVIVVQPFGSDNEYDLRQIVDKITGYNESTRYNASYEIWKANIVEKSLGNLHHLQRLIFSDKVESGRVIPTHYVLFQPDLNSSYHKDFQRIFSDDKGSLYCAKRLFATSMQPLNHYFRTNYLRLQKRFLHVIRKCCLIYC